MMQHGSFYLTCFYILLFLVATFGEQNDNKEDVSHYFYLNNETNPVHETLASQGLPPFLQPEYPKIRIVEFYADWCPHCQHFKPKYVKFAKDLEKLIKDSNLDLEVETKAVSCVPHKKTCTSIKLKGYPTIKLLLPYNSSTSELTQFDLESPTQFLKVLSNRTGVNYDISHQYQSKEVPQSNYFMHRTKKEIFTDSHLSLQFLLEDNIYMSNEPLSEGRQRKVLEYFLQILQQTLPSSSTMQPLLKDLTTHFDQVASGQNGLAKIIQPHKLNNITWSPSCKKHGNGFTCGLWTLFHISSVGFVKSNQHNVWNPDMIVTSGQIGDSLRDFIELYFRCEVCVDHFLYEYDSCDHDRCNRFSYDKDTGLKDWMEYPLWLFEMHNGVNARLRKERLEESQEANDVTTENEVIWPSRGECKTCWLSEGRWEEGKMYAWLSEYYWLENDKAMNKEQRTTSSGPLNSPAVARYAKSLRKTRQKIAKSMEGPGSGVMLIFCSLGLAFATILLRKRRCRRKVPNKKV